RLLAQVEGGRVAVTRVEAEGNVQSAPAHQAAQALELVVGQRVHGVDEHGLKACDTLPFAPEDAVQHGQQKGFGFARTGSRGDYEGTAPAADPESPLLMGKERAVTKGPAKLQE